MLPYEIIPAKSPDTIEEEFILPFCECGHLLSGPDNEHLWGMNCTALIFHGSWMSCDCTKPRPAIFSFVFYEEELITC